LPLEITRDIARENDLDVEETGFYQAMESHRLASSAGHGIGEQHEEDLEVYRQTLDELISQGSLGSKGVEYDPYADHEWQSSVLALIRDGSSVQSASAGDKIGVVLPSTHFYVEAGGQVSDHGSIVSLASPDWEIAVDEVREPIGGLIVHYGSVVRGSPRVGDQALGSVDQERRWDIMRNHTATHLLHAALRSTLGQHARQAGSLVAPDRLRFDFTHSEAMTAEELEQVEHKVNQAILENLELHVVHKPRKEAMAEGAIALFGETYGDSVRTVSIGDERQLSYELCGGTHVPETGVIGPFLIVSEGSVASGIRRIEAVTGRVAQATIRSRLQTLKHMTDRLNASPENLENKLDTLLDERDRLTREVAQLQAQSALANYYALQAEEHAGVPVLTGQIPNATAETLRQLTDRFRTDNPTGVVVLASAPEGRPIIVAAISKDLVARGLHAGELVKAVSKVVGGGGGGKPTLAQAGGNDPAKLSEALALVPECVRAELD
jgi:alanyl-tRNA synthetase